MGLQACDFGGDSVAPVKCHEILARFFVNSQFDKRVVWRV